MLNEIAKHCIRLELVGSRVTCSPAPTDTDQDVLCLVADHGEFRQMTCERGFSMDGSEVLDLMTPLDSADRFSSYSFGETNLIVTQRPSVLRSVHGGHECSETA